MEGEVDGVWFCVNGVRSMWGEDENLEFVEVEAPFRAPVE